MQKMIVNALILTLAAAVIPARSEESVVAFEFNEKQIANRYHRDFVRFLTYDEGKIPFRDGVLLIGSSSMGGWRDHKNDMAPLDTAKRGFGGSVMEEVLLFEDFFLRYEAGKVIIYEGDNDIWRGTKPEVFVSQCRRFSESLLARRTDTQIYFLSVKPSISRWAKWPIYEEANRLLKGFTETDERLYYIDIASPMLGDDGKPLPHIFVNDNLHLNRAGYEIWRDAIREALGLEPITE